MYIYAPRGGGSQNAGILVVLVSTNVLHQTIAKMCIYRYWFPHNIKCWEQQSDKFVRHYVCYFTNPSHAEFLLGNMKEYLYPRPTKLEGGGYTGFTLSVHFGYVAWEWWEFRWSNKWNWYSSGLNASILVWHTCASALSGWVLYRQVELTI